MSSTGAIAANFHEGARSEYLALYAFSAFGTAIPAPRPEDYGVDLFCTLGYRLGQRFHIENYYSVQVKSVEDDIIYDGSKAVQWLLSLLSPLLLAFVDKASGRIRVFASLGVSMLFAKPGLEFVRLIPEAFPEEFARHNQSPKPCAEHSNGRQVDVYLGNPILDFEVVDLQDSDFVARSREVIASWLRIDQANIEHKSMGYTFFHMPSEGEPNRPAGELNQVVGNFLDSINTLPVSAKHVETLFKSLCQQMNIAASNLDIEHWETLYKAALSSVRMHPDCRSGAAFFALVASVCTGAKHLNQEVDQLFLEYGGNAI